MFLPIQHVLLDWFSTSQTSAGYSSCQYNRKIYLHRLESRLTDCWCSNQSHWTLRVSWSKLHYCCWVKRYNWGTGTVLKNQFKNTWHLTCDTTDDFWDWTGAASNSDTCRETRVCIAVCKQHGHTKKGKWGINLAAEVLPPLTTQVDLTSLRRRCAYQVKLNAYHFWMVI